MNILHICDYSAPYEGNFINTLRSLEKYKDIRNIYIFPYRARSSEAMRWIAKLNSVENVAYIQHKNVFKNIFMLIRIFRDYNIEFVFRHFTDIKIDFILKFVFGKYNVVRFFHSMYKSQTWKHSLRKILWKNNILIGVSKPVTDVLKKAFDEFQVFNVDNAVDFKRLKVQSNLDRCHKKISLLVMGYSVRTKGVDLALKAVSMIKRKYNVVLNIVCAANEESLIECIEELFGTVPLWVNLLPPTDDIADYYYRNDIFLSPSRTEAFGYAVVESAYCNNSIVASKVGGQAQLTIDGVYWFENEDVDELYRQIELAIQQLNTSDKIKQRIQASKFVENKYSLKRWCDEIENIIKFYSIDA